MSYQDRSFEKYLRDSVEAVPSKLDKGMMYAQFEELRAKKNRERRLLFLLPLLGLLVSLSVFLGISQRQSDNLMVESNRLDQTFIPAKSENLKTDAKAELSKTELNSVKTQSNNKLENATPTVKDVKDKGVQRSGKESLIGEEVVLANQKTAFQDQNSTNLLDPTIKENHESASYGKRDEIQMTTTIGRAPTVPIVSLISPLSLTSRLLNIKHSKLIHLSTHTKPSIKVDNNFIKHRYLGIEANYNSLSDYSTSQFIESTQIDRISIQVNYLQDLTKNLKIKSSLGYGRYVITEEGSIQLPENAQDLSTESFESLIYRYYSDDQITSEPITAPFAANYTINSIFIGLGLHAELPLSNTLALYGSLTPMLSLNSFDQGEWHTNNRALSIDEFKASDLKTWNISNHLAIGLNKYYDESTMIFIGAQLFNDLSTRRTQSKNWDKINGLGFEMGFMHRLKN